MSRLVCDCMILKSRATYLRFAGVWRLSGFAKRNRISIREIRNRERKVKKAVHRTAFLTLAPLVGIEPTTAP